MKTIKKQPKPTLCINQQPPIFCFDDVVDVRKASQWNGEIYWVGLCDPKICLGALSDDVLGAWYSAPEIQVRTPRGCMRITIPDTGIAPSRSLLKKIVLMHLNFMTQEDIKKAILDSLACSARSCKRVPQKQITSLK